MGYKVKVLGHPVHPMLIAFPLGLLPVGVLLDVVYLSTSNSRWAEMSFWAIAGGVVGGLLAAVFGLIDWIGIQSGTRGKRIGLWHGGINVVTTALFALSLCMRWDAPALPTKGAIIVGFAGLVFALVGAWLGGELVYRLHIGVDPGAHPDSPSSLSNQPASANKKAGA